MNVLILGGGLQGLSCGASLKERGYKVDIVSSGSDIRFSSFFTKVYDSDILSDINVFFETVLEYNYDIILPISDVCVSFTSRNKHLIENTLNVKCACPEYDLLKIVENKQQFMEFCKKQNIPCPNTETLLPDNLEDCANKIGFPSLIKPDFSVGARGITRVDSIAELRERYNDVHAKYGECTLQELVENDDYYYNVMLYRNVIGEYLGSTIIKIVRKYPIDAGSSSFCISVENDSLLKICKDCLDKLNWVGMADFDVLQNKNTHEYKVIEINARVPASVRAAAISKVNFPEIIICDTLGETVPKYEYSSGKMLRYLGIDIMWFLKSPQRFKASPSWFKFWGKNLFYQDIYAMDYSTWWTWLIVGLSKLIKRNKKPW